MKKLILLSLVVFGFTLANCSKDPVDNSCFDPELKEMMADSICPPTNCQDPVCACNGQTWCSPCEALKAGYTVSDTVPCPQ